MTRTLSLYWPVSNNFGDLIGKYILEKMADAKVIYAEAHADYEHYVIGGSVINHAGPKSIIWGAGLGTITDGINAEMKIAAVRGPYTRARALSLGVKCPAIYGDPGMLLPRFYTPTSKRDRKVGVVPHYVDQFRAYSRYAGEAHIIDVFQPIECVIEDINSCEVILSSSLHGIIIAHAYGVPAAWVKISDSVGGDGTKFRDYFASVGLDVAQPFDMREMTGVPVLPTYLPKSYDPHVFWDACPIPGEFRAPEFR